MKNSTLVFPIAIRLITAFVLIYAACVDHEYGYYSFLRWWCFLSFWYFAGKGAQQKMPLQTIVFLPLIILFNPIFKIHFERETWAIIDYVAGGLSALSIVFDFMRKR